MNLIKQLFNWYIKASIHVALAAVSLVGVTYFYAQLTTDISIVLFVFFSTISSYNIVKYAPYVLTHKQIKLSLKAIIVLTFLSLMVCAWCFFKFNTVTQLVIIFLGFLNLLYVVPISKTVTNLRNISGVKIYIVSFCWAGVTLLLPLLQANLELSIDMILKFVQRFVLTLVLILIFEIKDLKVDDIYLKTVPQTIGIIATKKLIYILLCIFYILDFFKVCFYPKQAVVNLILLIIIMYLTYFVTPNRSYYYTNFFAESVPIIWLFLIYLF